MTLLFIPEPVIHAFDSLNRHFEDYADKLFIENNQREDKTYDLHSYREMEMGIAQLFVIAKARALDCLMQGDDTGAGLVLQEALTRALELRKDFLERGLVIGRMY